MNGNLELWSDYMGMKKWIKYSCELGGEILRLKPIKYKKGDLRFHIQLIDVKDLSDNNFLMFVNKKEYKLRAESKETKDKWLKAV